MNANHHSTAGGARAARRGRRAACIAVFAYLGLLSSTLRAEPASIVPPRLVHAPAPTYPEGGEGDAKVVLYVVVGADGTPRDITTVEGAEPFASAAVEAVRGYTFTPAERGDTKVAARIRVDVSFSAPPRPEPTPAQPTSVDATVTPKPDSSPPPPPPPEEVRVVGARPPPRTPTEHRMGRADVRVIPGAFGDPFRAIDTVPSVVPVVSGLPYFYVRGAPPSAVGYFVDEVRVPYLFHFGAGPSAIHPALVEEVALHPAAFPARFGRYAGGIVAGETRAPGRELRGEGQIRLYDAGAYVETPFANGRGAVGVGGRYSYTGALVSLLAEDLTLAYRDYNLRATYAINDDWRATAFAFGSFDYASTTPRDVEEVVFASEFHRLDLRLDRQAGGSFSRIAATLGLDRSLLEGRRFAQDVMIGVRARHETRLSDAMRVEVGADAALDSYRGDIPSPYAAREEDYRSAVAFFSPRLDTATGAYGALTWRRRATEVTATLRADVFTSADAVAIGPSPRLTVRAPVVDRVAFVAALGVAPQPPAFAIPIPAVGYRGLPGGLAYAYQKSVGLTADLPAAFTLRVVAFHHTYLSSRDVSRNVGKLEFDQDRETNAANQAFGSETSLTRRLTGRFAAFATATLSRSVIGSTTSSSARLSPFDRAFVVQVGGAVDLGRNWRASSRVLAYGGWPAETAAGGVASVAPVDRRRLPAFYRVDARIEKRWIFTGSRSLGLVFEGLNVTGSKEVIGRRCTAGGSCRDETFGPVVIPNIALEGTL